MNRKCFDCVWYDEGYNCEYDKDADIIYDCNHFKKYNGDKKYNGGKQ